MTSAAGANSATSPQGDSETKAASPSANSDYVLSPIWSTKRSLVIGGVCMPRRMTPTKARRADEDYYVGDDESVRIDIAGFDRALELATISAKRGDPRRILFSINFNNLKSPEMRDVYERRVNSVAESTAALIIPRLVRVPFGTPPSTVLSLSGFLRERFPALCLEACVSPYAPRLQVHADVGQSITAISMREVERLSNRYGGTASLLRRFARTAHANASRALVHSVETPSEASFALASKIDFLCGPAVHPNASRMIFPKAIQRRHILEGLVRRPEEPAATQEQEETRWDDLD